MKLSRPEKHKRYWRERQINWKTAYLDTWEHPHRLMLSDILKRLPWHSLFEVGCGPGPNLMRFVKDFPNVVVGGNDVSEDAIKLAKETFNGAHLKVGSAEDIMMSDNSTDVVLSDMTLIYVGEIDKAIKEMRRVARNYIVLCELHSPSWFDRIRLRLSSGYYAYDYKKLLTKHGFHDITLIKIPKEVWDGKPQVPYGYIIVARVPKDYE